MTGHYVKGSARGTRPGRIVSVVVESQPVESGSRPSTRVDKTFKRIFASWVYRKNNAWSIPCSAVFGTAYSFWDHLERASQSKSRCIVVAPVASDALTLAQFWDRLERVGAVWKGGPEPVGLSRPHSGQGEPYSIRKLICRGKPDIIEYSRSGASWLWVSGCQYLDLTPDELAKAIGYTRDVPPDPGAGEGIGAWTDRELSRLWLAAIMRLADWWAPLNAGPFPKSVPAAAAAFMRSRITKKGLCTHTNQTAGALERLACHGGRASVWDYRHYCPLASGNTADELPYPPSPYGAGRGPLYHLDYSSMYPHILSDMQFPTKLTGVSDDVPIEDLRELCEHFCVIAHVSIESDRAEYPHRWQGRAVHPVGRYSTTLSTPEILQALQERSITAAHCVSTYALGRPYQRAADELMRMREAEKRSGNQGWELFTKLLSNSLTGRLAMRSGQWVPRPDVAAERRWGEWIVAMPDGTAPERYRSMAGLVWQMVRDDSGPGTLTAGYAHITSYGRVMMRKLREACPPHSVIQQDTDGVWVTAGAVAALRESGYTNGLSTSTLVQKATGRFVRFWTPKHYHVDGQWTAAGLHCPEFAYQSSKFTDTTSRNGCHTSPDSPPRTITEVTRVGSLELVAVDCTIGPDGYATPLVFPFVPGQHHGLGGGGGGGGGLWPDS